MQVCSSLFGICDVRSLCAHWFVDSKNHLDLLSSLSGCCSAGVKGGKHRDILKKILVKANLFLFLDPNSYKPTR